MISHNCLSLIDDKESGLLHQARQCIKKIESEISFIDTLMQNSSSLQLSSWDLAYYQSELNKLLYGSKELIHCISSFLDSLDKLFSTESDVTSS